MQRAPAWLALLVALALPVHAGYVPRAEVQVATQSAAIEAKTYTDAAATVAALQQAQIRSDIEPLAAEARLQQLLLRLREAPTASASTRDAVAALLEYAPKVMTDPVDPDHRGRPMPAFAIAGSARAVLQHWDRVAAQAAYRRALASADLVALADVTHASALAAVVRSATAGEVALVLQAKPASARVQRALFERTADPAIASALLHQAPEPETLDLPADVVARLSPATALAVLSDPAIDAGHVSAARMAIGALVAAHAPAREVLLARLQDEAGASSAAALARTPDAATFAALADILATGGDGLRQRRALLALRLTDDARARTLLHDYADDARQPTALRDQVRAWLR